MLALIALHGGADLQGFDQHFRDPAVRAFAGEVSTRVDAEVDAAYPARWIGKVIVETVYGQFLAGRVDEPKGDPGNALGRNELKDKALRLAAYREGSTAAEMRSVVERVWALSTTAAVGPLLRAADGR